MCEVINFKNTLIHYQTFAQALKCGSLKSDRIVLVDVSPVIRAYIKPENEMLQNNCDIETLAYALGSEDVLESLLDTITGDDENETFSEDNPDANANFFFMAKQLAQVADKFNEVVLPALTAVGFNGLEEEIHSTVMLRNGKLAVCINKSTNE